MLLLLTFAACRNATPAVEAPLKTAHATNYQFQVPKNARWIRSQSDNPESEWHVLYLDSLEAELYLTYTELGHNRRLDRLVEDATAMAVKHGRFASSLDRHSFSDGRRRIWGSYFKITGETASPIQFYATDSTHNWLRGALYLTRPDSLGQRTTLLEADLKKMLSSLSWKARDAAAATK